MKWKVRCDLNIREDPTVFTLVRLKLGEVGRMCDKKDYEVMEV